MKPELYFDISSEESGGSLYKAKDTNGTTTFTYQHSMYDEYSDVIEVRTTAYASFKDFWQELTQNTEWFYLHPLYVHPEVRSFVQAQLQNVNWNIYPDRKWQESHQRQWKKVLTDPTDYYNPFKKL